MNFKGKAYHINLPAGQLYSRLTNLSELQDRMGQLPEELRAKMGTVNFPEPNVLAFTAPGVGEMKFKVASTVPEKQVRYVCETGVMPINVIIDINATNDASCDISASIDANIPMMVKPLVGPKLQEAADKFGEMFGQLNA